MRNNLQIELSLDLFFCAEKLRAHFPLNHKQSNFVHLTITYVNILQSEIVGLVLTGSQNI